MNTLHVPVEQTLRHRSASVSSLRQESFMTMDPEARFITPVPAPALAANAAIRRLGSASSLLQNRSSSRSSNRSESVGPSWKRFFSRKLASRDLERPSTSGRSYDRMMPFACPLPDSRPTSSSDGRRTRDISPESLRRFLIDDPPLPPAPVAGYSPPALEIPNELIEEADDDDDNFATSATSDTQVFATRLSPPPFQRSVSSDTVPHTITNSSSLTLTIRPAASQQDNVGKEPLELTEALQLPKLNTTEISQCDLSPSISSSTFATPMSPQSLAEELPSFYDSNEDEDFLSSNDGDYLSYRTHRNHSARQSFKGYCLPRLSEEHKSTGGSSPQMATNFNTTSFLTSRVDSGVPISGTNFLGGPIDTGLDDFVNELGLMVDGIGNKST